MEVIRLIVPEEYDDTRADKVIAALLSDSFSRTRIKQLITDGHVSLNGAALKKGSVAVFEDDEIAFELPEIGSAEIRAEDIPLDILYEDSDVLVVNKQKGMVFHPAAGHPSGTLVNALMYHCGSSLSGIGGVLRPGIVHRIDKDTTGCLIVCKNDIAHRHIAAQIKEHIAGRVYEAIVYGVVKDDEGVIDAPIGRSRTDRKKMAVDREGGKRALTRFRVLNRFEGDKYTHIECRLETGRTHQIRVHMASLSHPVLGDTVYAPGRKSAFKTDGQCLHARTIEFIRPSDNEKMTVEAPLPDYFTRLLSVMR